MKHNIVYHMALRLYSLVRHKDYKVALELCGTISEQLKQLVEENKKNG